MNFDWLKEIQPTIIFYTAFLLLNGCTLANIAINPYDKITIIASKEMNPDINQRPSPILIKVFHLTTRATFDNLDFDQLFFNGKQLLSDELILESQYTLQPKQVIKDKLAVDKGTQFVAILAAFRDIDNSDWRYVMPISDTHYYSHKFQVTKNAIILLTENSRKYINQPQLESVTDNAKATNQALDQGKALSDKANNF